MAKVTKEDLIWLCEQIKTQIDKRVPFDTQEGEGKFLQTNYAGQAVWADPPIFEEGRNVVTQIYSAIQAVSNLIASQYTEKSYEVGEFVIYNNGLYKCNTEISEAETWNSLHWDSVVMSDETFEVDKALSIVSQIREYIEHGEWVTKVNNVSGEVMLYGSNIQISNSNEASILNYIDDVRQHADNITTIATRAEIQSLFS